MGIHTTIANELQGMFPYISFNDDPKKRNKDHYLFLLDNAIIAPKSHDIKVMSLYKGIVTWNPRAFDQMMNWGANAFKISEYPRFDDMGELDEFIPLEEKDGICAFQHDVIHDFSHKQLEIFSEVRGFSHHAYGNNGYGGQFNKGDTPTKLDKLKIINSNKFCVVFENVYHPLWSWNYITQGIYDCFKAKTMPIYMGAYNIDDIIPPSLFIDYRDFRNPKELSEFLMEFDSDVYNKTVETAYKFSLQTRWNLAKFEAALKKLSGASNGSV